MLVGCELTPGALALARRDLRFALARLREHAESVAFYGGAAAEYRHSNGLLVTLRTALLARIACERRLTVVVELYGHLTSFLPMMVLAKPYFAGSIEMGEISQAGMAYGGEASHTTTAITQCIAPCANPCCASTLCCARPVQGRNSPPGCHALCCTQSAPTQWTPAQLMAAPWADPQPVCARCR